MKKINLILSFLFLTCLLFGQSSSSVSKSTRSSISVSEEENSYSLKASFSEGINEQVKEALFEFMGEENARPTRKGYLWEKYNGKDLAYRFLLEKKRCEINLKTPFLEEIEYKNLVDLCIRLQKMMGNEKTNNPGDSKKEKEKEVEDPRSNISIKGDASINISGNPVNLKTNEEVFILSAKYKNDLKNKLEKKLNTELGNATSKRNGQTEWSQKEKGELVYQYLIKKRSCKIFVDKTKCTKAEARKLEQLGYDLAGIIF